MFYKVTIKAFQDVKQTNKEASRVAPGYLESYLIEAVGRSEWRPFKQAARFHCEGAVVAMPP
jgi:hypothetical protein